MPQSAWLPALEVLYPPAAPWYFEFMPYEVTATRKRPQNFEQLAGQEFVAATLEASLATGRIAHAYLFSGPRGCGKTSTARILAKALNCEKGPAAHPCGECDSCKSIASGSSLDVIEIDGASNTSVENVRQIKDEVLFPPNSSRYKIYIIDEVHMLSTSAFNALLKTIEEPPPYVIFMFATTEPHKVPATIKSRCQQFTFRLVAADVVKGLLANVASEMGLETEDEALLWIARESGGSIRDAYTLFDQIASFSEGKITAALIREKLGLVGQDRMNELFSRLVSGDTAGALSFLDSIAGAGVSAEQFLLDSVEYARSLLLLKNGITKEGLLGAPVLSFDQKVLDALSVERIEQIFAILLDTYRHLRESIDPRYDLEFAVARLSHIRHYVAPSDLARAVGSLKKFLEKGTSSSSEISGLAANKDQRILDASDSAGNDSAAVVGSRGAGSAKQAADKQEASSDKNLVDASGKIDLAALKASVVAEVRRNNSFLAAALDRSGAWRSEGADIAIPVSGQMEIDLVKRFVGIIAEIVAKKLGAPKRLDVVSAEKALSSATIGESESSAIEFLRGDNDESSRENGSASAPLKSILGKSPVAIDSNDILPGEKEAISQIERVFKGSMVGLVDAGTMAAQSSGDSSAAKTIGARGSKINQPDAAAAEAEEADLDSAQPEFVDSEDSDF